jgi:hypothetical protein
MLWVYISLGVSCEIQSVIFDDEQVDIVLKKVCLEVAGRYQVENWDGEFWTDGYFASTVGKHGDEQMIGKYLQNQGNTYQKLHADYQLALS